MRTIKQILSKIKISWILFVFSIAFFSALFYLQRSFMTNFDENDHLAVAYFMQHGKLLYKDIFSHHFPFPYYWTYLFTPLWSQFSPSRTISIFRLSILFLYLLTLIPIFISYRNSKSRSSISFWILLISLVLPIYHGNLVLSETFSAIFIIGLFWICLPIFLGWEKLSKFSLYFSILLSSLAFWTQPLLFFLSFIPLLLSPKKEKIKILFLIILINLIPLIFFSLTQQIVDFYYQAIWFNFKIYPNFYVDTIPFGQKWWGTLLYFFSNQLFLLTHFFNKNQIFQFITNIGLISLIILIIKKSKNNYFIPFFLIFLSCHIREPKIIPGQIFNFGILPLILVSTSAFFVLFNYFKKNIFIITIAVVLFLVSFSVFLPILKNSLDSNYNYHVFWSPRQNIGSLIQQISLPSERILIYPHDVDLYYFSNRLAPDRFVYWFPWIDAVSEFHQQRSFSLSNSPPSVIYVGNLDFKGEKNYYSKYFPNLTQGYLEVIKDNQKTNIWIRSDLSNRLQPLNLSVHTSTSE